MTLTKFFFLAMVLGTFAFASCNNSGKGSKDKADSINKANKPVAKDAAQFMTKAAEINMEEIELGTLAQQRATSQRVKDFGKMLVNDHSQLNEKVSMLASRKNIVLPNATTEKIARAKQDLENTDDFDTEFIKMMVKGHKDAIDVFQRAADHVNDPDIKSLATSALPQLQTHLDSAQRIREDLK